MKNLKVARNRGYKGYFPLKNKIDRYGTLKVEVSYTLGGYSYFSGKLNPRGYKVYLTPCNVGNGFTESTLLSGNQKVEGGYVLVETANRYSAKRLGELAELIDPNVKEIVEAYETDNIGTLKELCVVGNAKEIVEPTSDSDDLPCQKSSQLALTKEIKSKLPPLGSTSEKNPEDVPVVVKFFDPTGSWTWYATEGEKIGTVEEGAFKGAEDYRFFGYVKGFEGELGYFTLGELSIAKKDSYGLQGLPIERDYKFTGTLAEVMKGG